ncbi:unnamed protein product, partial [Oppiella nova]
QILATFGWYTPNTPFAQNIVRPVTNGPLAPGINGFPFPIFTTPSDIYNQDLVTQSQMRCGLAVNMTRMLSTRIVGGVDVSISDYPWQVSLQRWSPYFGSTHFCGGSLIHPKWVMTAAHCLEWLSPFLFINDALTNIRVIAGSQTTTPSGNSLVLKISNAVLHPQYESKRGLSDIALISLDRPIRFLSNRNLAVNSVCLPTDKNIVINKRLITTGWGATQEEGDDSYSLRAVELPFVSNKQCKQMYGRGFSPELELCAGAEGKDSCQGDSGGPLIQKDRTGRATVVGIVSTGNGCGRPGYPGLYTRVSYYIDWINEIISLDN